MIPSVCRCRDEDLEMFPNGKTTGQHYRTIRDQSEPRAADNESALSEPSAEDRVPERTALKWSPH